MKTLLTLFLRRSGRRATQLVAPVMLLLGLSGFALAQMPYANTLWSQELTLSASLDIATPTATATNTPLPTATPTNTPVTTCEPVVTLVSHVYTSGTNSTTYTYTVARGGTPGSQCQTVSYFALNVCFNPGLSAGVVTAETHPEDYFYDPSNGSNPKRIKWGGSNDNTDPNNLVSPFNITFTVTVAGNVAPVNTTWELHAGANSTRSGPIQGPGPSSCGNLTGGTSAPLAANGISPNACLPLTLTSEPVRETDGRSKFSYRLAGGSASGKDGCPAIETVILPVCFNPYLDPRGWLVEGSTARDWRYAGQMEDPKAVPALVRAATWNHEGDRGPWKTSISFVAPGDDLPTVKVRAIGRDASGADHDLGEVQVPRPVSCEAATATATATLTSTPTATPEPAETAEPGDEETPLPGPTDEPGSTDEPAPTDEPEPTATPVPTQRPRNPPPGSSPTPTPPNGGAVWWD